MQTTADYSGAIRMGKYLFVAGTLLLTAFGQLIIKARLVAIGQPVDGKISYLIAVFLDPWVWSGLAGAVLAAVFWILALGQLSVSIAYPFMALAFLIVPLGALLFLHEEISTIQWLGYSIIIVGVVITSLGAPK
jgi:drug/metabolite transporter (DMT)-like permease